MICVNVQIVRIKEKYLKRNTTQIFKITKLLKEYVIVKNQIVSKNIVNVSTVVLNVTLTVNANSVKIMLMI